MRNEIIKIAEELTKIAEELVKLAPRRPRREPPLIEEVEKTLEEMRRIPVEERMRRVRVREDEMLIEVVGKYGETLNRLLAELQKANAERRALENKIAGFRSALEKYIEEGLHIKLKKEMDFETALETLRRREEEGEKATLIVVRAMDKVAKLSEFIRFSLSREKIIALPSELKERLIRELGNYPQLIDRIIATLHEILSEMVKVSAGLMANVDDWKEAVEQARETETTEAPPEATASLSIQAQRILTRVWEWIKNLFGKILSGIRKLFDLETKYVETLEDLDATLDDMEKTLDLVRI